MNKGKHFPGDGESWWCAAHPLASLWAKSITTGKAGAYRCCQTSKGELADDMEEVRDRAHQKLQELLNVLQEARKSLRRDWGHPAPRERSAQSRVVKELEQQKRSLEEEIEMNSIG